MTLILNTLLDAEADQLVSLSKVGAPFIVFAFKPIQINQ
jgi:hypothetical protein